MTAKNSRKSLLLRADCDAIRVASAPSETLKRVGYVRVSTGEQNTDLQYDALKKAGCDPIFEDRITGVAFTRDGLDRALAYIGQGDKLVVWRLDRLGRSIPHVMTIVGDLANKGASLVSIGEGFDTGNEAGELYSTILAMIAHVERRMIVARTKAGLAAAKARGVRLGAKPKMHPCQIAEAASLMRTEKAEAVAHRFSISRATLFRHLRTHRGAQNLLN
ncbi:recombinase family protein [Sphingopyxis sp. Geo48]|uniref:recombinase family protein n=1 Tax=Sphingopyxis sp. Geo48 TaxID=545241 RepID=UPI0024B81F73|nr:recombinase family protein [Sphingopyxis sp. Geo48]